MTDNFGTGVSRVLDPKSAQFLTAVKTEGTPVLDSDLNFAQQISQEVQRLSTLQGAPSGWLGDTAPEDVFWTQAEFSNWFQFGLGSAGDQSAIQWAAVNGWLVPVTGTQTGLPPGSPDNVDFWNRITLPPPPSNSGESRIDFVFLEVWQALVGANPATANKPAANAIYRYGNVEGGFSYLADDIADPNLGETTRRVQLQYRIRVVPGLVGLTSYPDGFDPAIVKGQGASLTETSFSFTNMGRTLGDPGLWRAGTGVPNTLGTVDGYTYAIPLCAVFRRNSVAWDGDPGQNLNGSITRNPDAASRDNWKTFTATATLAADITATSTTASLVSAVGIPLPSSPLNPVYVKIGDEILTYSSISGLTLNLTTRGAYGTRAEQHRAGATVQIISGRPDGLFADQIVLTDVLDLRHVSVVGGVDYSSTLKTNFEKLIRGQLRANWKRSGAGPQGPMLTYQDKISTAAAALGVAKLDGPNGIRTVWSDTAVAQRWAVCYTRSGTSITTNYNTNIVGVLSSATPGTTFAPGDIITIGLAPFKAGVSDVDQVHFPLKANDPADPWVKLYVGPTGAQLTPGVHYTVAVPADVNSNLVITLLTSVSTSLIVVGHTLYGAGRGVSHRPDSVHSVAAITTEGGTLRRPPSYSSNNYPLSVGWYPLSGFHRSRALNGMPPVVAESYVDPGSKTAVITPYKVSELGILPTVAISMGADYLPLSSASSSTSSLLVKDMAITLPRDLIPGWGEVYCPVVSSAQEVSGVVSEGLNYLFSAPKTINPNSLFLRSGDSKNYLTFATVDLPSLGTSNLGATYNVTQTSIQGATAIGSRLYSVGGKQGIELPPYLAPARLFAVYEAADYVAKGSAYNGSSQQSEPAGATNLLRQDFKGPAYWITLDAQGNSTFVLNADAIDITRSPNAISNFASGRYVLEAACFGFSVGSFDLGQPFRIVAPQGVSGTLTSFPSLVLPQAPEPSLGFVVNYSHTAYQGDVWGSQFAQQDTPQLVGPLSSGDAYQLAKTELNETMLSKPNPKTVEVLASLNFITTSGSGRIAGDYSSTASDYSWNSPACETEANFPPALPASPRPLLNIGDVLSASDDLLSLSTDALGFIERLPLGSLFRDKDFKGEAIPGSYVPTPFLYVGSSVGAEAVQVCKSTVVDEVAVNSGSASIHGVQLAHVDGEPGNYALTTNYRTNRGGSVFVSSGPRPGSDVSCVVGSYAPGTHGTAILAGTAYLVRNAPTTIGTTEVSAGSELQMLIVTTATRRNGASKRLVHTLCGTSGSGEGFSAADLYRIEGHPLVKGSSRVKNNPVLVPLAPKTSLKGDL